MITPMDEITDAALITVSRSMYVFLHPPSGRTGQNGRTGALDVVQRFFLGCNGTQLLKLFVLRLGDAEKGRHGIG